MDISVYMPVYNGSEFIKRCIDSVLSSEFDGTFEFIIVDDGSEDNTVELIKEYEDKRIKLFECEHKGIVEASNYGLEQCSGKYIARIDADDTMEKNRLQKQFDFLESHLEYGMCHCGCLIQYKNLSFNYLPKDFEITFVGLMMNVAMVHSCIMYRRDLGLRYDKEFEWAEDKKMYMEASYNGVKIYNIKDVLCTKYMQPKSIGVTKSKQVHMSNLKARKHFRDQINKARKASKK